jgi:hypothetical protein
LKLKRIYNHAKEEKSNSEAYAGIYIAKTHVYEALADGEVSRAREYQIEVCQWQIKVLRCYKYDDMAEVRRTEIGIRMHEAEIKQHEAWERGDMVAARQSQVDHEECVHYYYPFNQNQAYKYEADDIVLSDPIIRMRGPLSNNTEEDWKRMIDGFKLQSEDFRTDVPWRESTIRKVCEKARLLTAIFQAFRGKFASDRDRAVAICVQNYLISFLKLYFFF